MTKKIFKSIVIVSLCAIFLTLILITSLLYEYFSKEQVNNLKRELNIIKAGIELDETKYLSKIKNEEYRITLIDRNGKVLFDNKENPKKMKNHNNREEIIEARNNKIGKSSRYSSTLTEKYVYVAKKLCDNKILRLSDSYNSSWILVLRLLQPIVIVLAILLIFAFIFAKKISKSITSPLNEIDLDKPLEAKSYKELEPFLKRINSQEVKIQKQELKLLKKEEANDKLENKRREFTSNVSHELKTPLQTISGYSELLKNNMVKDSDISKIGETIYNESNRLTLLVNDIIDLAKLDENNLAKKELVDIYEVITNVLNVLENKIQEKNIKIKKDICHIIVNQVYKNVYGIIYNLIDNAIKYNKDGGDVILTLKDYDDKACFICKDTGIGIPSDDINNIFERFYMVDKSRSKKITGTGLGLSIVKHSVEKCNGTIEVNSKFGEGTTFTIILQK